MADKAYIDLDRTDMMLRMSTPIGMESGVKQLIIRTCGFELFNNRPYHNYETWSDGWIIMGRKDGKATTAEWLISQMSLGVKDQDENFMFVSKEDLDDAAKAFAKEIGAYERVEDFLLRAKNKRNTQQRVVKLKSK